MSTALEKLIDRRGSHAVGYFSAIVEPRQIDGGALCAADIDNTELVDIYFAEENGYEVPYCKPLENNDEKGYIAYSSEILHDSALETKLDFFNGEGTMCSAYVQEAGVTFKTNNFVCAAGEPVKGMWAQWVVGKNADGPCPNANGYYNIVADKPEGNNVFMVWGTTEDATEELLGLDTIELYIPMV